MRKGTSRDGRQQSRLVRGDSKGFEICTVDHAKGGAIRVDATITYRDDTHEVGVYEHEDIKREGEEFFKVYAPSAGDDLHGPDEAYIPYNDDGMVRINEKVTKDSKAWWYLSCGRVLCRFTSITLTLD